MASKLVIITILFMSFQAVFGEDLGSDVSANITTNALYTAADVLTGIGQILAPIINIITGIPNTLLSVATGVVPGASAFQSTINNIIRAFTMAIANTLGQLLRFAGTGVGGVTSLIGSVLGTIQKVAGQGIKDGLNITGSIGDLINAGANFTTNRLMESSILQLPLQGLTAATNMMNGVLNTTQGVVNTAGQIALSVTDTTSKTIHNLVDTMRNRISASG